jgi:hypothetical protein
MKKLRAHTGPGYIREVMPDYNILRKMAFDDLKKEMDNNNISILQVGVTFSKEDRGCSSLYASP